MNALPRLADRRAAAAGTFRADGLPDRKVEDWKYTDFRRAVGADAVAGAGSARWTIENLPDGVKLFDLAAGDLPEIVGQHLGALTGNTTSALDNASLAFAGAGFALWVPKGLKAGTVRVRISGAGHLRMLVLAEEDAALTLMEIHDAVDGDGGGIRNAGLEIYARPRAEIIHLRLAARAESAVTNESIEAILQDGARYCAHYANFGAKLSRVELHAVLEGNGAEACISGVSVLGGHTHADVTTHIEHAGASRSNQLFKYVVGSKSRAVYQGRITVRPGADGTDSRQSAKAILLDPLAEADLKPELLIFADDVKCAHGAAVGDLDEDSLFYLKSRGLDETEARDLLLRAFLSEAVDEVADEAARSEIWQAAEAALRTAMEPAS